MLSSLQPPLSNALQFEASRILRWQLNDCVLCQYHVNTNDRIRNHLVAKPSSSVSASLEAKKIITKDNEFSPARIEFPSKWNLCA